MMSFSDGEKHATTMHIAVNGSGQYGICLLHFAPGVFSFNSNLN